MTKDVSRNAASSAMIALGLDLEGEERFDKEVIQRGKGDDGEYC